MHRIAIVDDDPTQRDRLTILTRRICMPLFGAEPEIRSFATTEDLERAICEAGMRNDPARFCGVALMDIEFDGERNGIEATRTLFPEECGVQVIYITGFIEYCTAVYETAHVSFLLKPVKRDQLAHALQQAASRAAAAIGTPLRVTVGKREQLIRPERILYIESRLRVLNIHCANGVIRTYQQLGDIEPLLPDYFLRCHTSYLVNLRAVDMSTGNDLLLSNGEKVPISQRRRRAVHDAIAAYLRNVSDSGLGLGSGSGSGSTVEGR